MTPDILMRRGRLEAAERYPYFASGLWSMTLIPKKGLAQQALGPIGVDKRWRVYYDPEVIGKHDIGEVSCMLIHEVGHLIRVHADRMGTRNPIGWNIAGDCEINDDFPEIPKALPWVVMPQKFGCKPGLTAEQYYEQMAKEAEEQAKALGKNHDCGSCAGGKERDYEDPVEGDGGGLDEHETEMIKAQIAEDVRKQRGLAPAGLERWADEFLRPQADWKTVLAREIRRAFRTTSGCVDYSYRRPARRQWGDVILPAMIAPLIEATIVIDTSGSMSPSDIGVALAETKGICKAVGTVPTVLFVDAAVHGKVRADSGLSRHVRGGGGTDMTLGIEEALKEKPDIVIVLTDGETGWPEQAPRVPVIAGLVRESHYHGYGVEDPPSWMRVVRIGLGD